MVQFYSWFNFYFVFLCLWGETGGQEPESNGGVKSTGGGRRGGGRRDSQRGQELGGMGKILQHWHNISQEEKRKAGRSTAPPPLLLLLRMVMYNNKYKTKEKKLEPSMKLNNTYCTCTCTFCTATNIPRPGGLF